MDQEEYQYLQKQYCLLSYSDTKGEKEYRGEVDDNKKRLSTHYKKRLSTHYKERLLLDEEEDYQYLQEQRRKEVEKKRLSTLAMKEGGMIRIFLFVFIIFCCFLLVFSLMMMNDDE